MTTPEVQEVESGGMTEEQAVQSMLSKWVPKDDDDPKDAPEPETTDEPEAEQTDEVDADAEGENEEEGEESDDGEELDFGGKKFKFAKEAIEQARQVQATFKEMEAGATRKFQSAAEQSRIAEERLRAADELERTAQEDSSLYGQREMVVGRLRHIGSIDVNALAETDPVTLTKLNAEAFQLRSALERIDETIFDNKGKREQAKKQANALKAKHLDEFAKTNIKGWSPEYSNKLLDFAVQTLGVRPNTLMEELGEWQMRAIDLAYQGHKVRTADPKAKQLLNTKTLKPGSAAQTATTAHQSYEQARKKLGKSGSTEDAAMALLARARIRKR